MAAGPNDSDMHRDVDWMTPADRIIIQELANVAPRWQKPSTIYLNIGYSRYHIANRLLELADHGLVERLDEDTPAYRITSRGEQYLAGDLEPDDLRD